MKLLLLIYSIAVWVVSAQIKYGRVAKKNDCLLLFIVSNSGVNGTLDRGTCLCREYKDPRIDHNGYGTQYFNAIKTLYTECTQVVPVRIDLKKKNVWGLVDAWVEKECKRRKRMLNCNIISHLIPDRNLSIPIYENVYGISPVTLQAKLVNGLIVRGFTKK